MMRGGLVLALLLAFAGLVRGEDPWLARAFVPSTNSVHGEVRLLKRGDTACLQTLLYSKYLRRGLHEMAKKERAAWPEGWPCCDVSTNYLADLDLAKAEVLGAAPETTNGPGEVKRMLIEFNYSPTGCWYAVGDLELAGPPDNLEAVNSRWWVARSVHPHYVSRAMYLMSQQAFGLDDQEIRQQLEKAGWGTAAAPELPPAQRAVPR